MTAELGEVDTVLTGLSEGVLTLTLNRPEKLNSFNEAMHLALRAGIRRAHDDTVVRAVLLTGRGVPFVRGKIWATAIPGGVVRPLISGER